jgi:hypothetical protein
MTTHTRKRIGAGRTDRDRASHLTHSIGKIDHRLRVLHNMRAHSGTTYTPHIDNNIHFLQRTRSDLLHQMPVTGKRDFRQMNTGISPPYARKR